MRKVVTPMLLIDQTPRGYFTWPPCRDLYPCCIGDQCSVSLADPTSFFDISHSISCYSEKYVNINCPSFSQNATMKPDKSLFLPWLMAAFEMSAFEMSSTHCVWPSSGHCYTRCHRRCVTIPTGKSRRVLIETSLSYMTSTPVQLINTDDLQTF